MKSDERLAVTAFQFGSRLPLCRTEDFSSPSLLIQRQSPWLSGGEPKGRKN